MDDYGIYILMEYEKKLKELMTEKEYKEFVMKVAKEGFKKEIEGMVDSEFKDFCMENFEEIIR